MARHRLSLDIFGLRDDALEDTDNVPAPAVAAQIIEDLEAALAEFSLIAESLGTAVGEDVAEP